MTRQFHDIGRFLPGFFVAALCSWATLGIDSAHAADDLALRLPLDCTLGDDCWIVNYVDMDSTSGTEDFACRNYTYDGHKGTDFAIRDLRRMGEGVSVQASAGGIVAGVRDGMPDINVALVGQEALGGRECGNGIVIKHAGGWETQYCHLRQGSVDVKKGDVVEAGTHLGYVGQSGLAEFPHVHISVRHKGEIVDPFTRESPRSGGPDCSSPVAGAHSANGLWHANVFDTTVPQSTAVYNLGFSGVVPNVEAMRAGLYDILTISPTAPVLAMWVDAFRVNKGDHITMRMTKPDGKLLIEHAVVQEKSQARRWVFAGKKLKDSRWPAGTYVGEVTVTRSSDTGGAPLILERRELVIQ